MSSRAFKLTSLIVCDDIRQEVTGKQILVGVYTGTIILSSFPAALNKLCIRITGWVSGGVGTRKAVLAIDGPDKKNVLRDDSIVLNVARPDQQIVLNITLGSFEFREQGKYKIRFGVEGPARQVGMFIARVPESKREAKRLQTDKDT